MGAYASNEAENFGNIIAELCDPQTTDWIPAHAVALHTSPDTVTKLWVNYGRNSSTSDQNEDQKRDFTSFFDYCINQLWIQCGDLDLQLKETFKVTCPSGTLSRNELEAILKQLYKEESEPTILCLANLFYSQMSQNNSEYVTEDDVIAWLKKLPPDVVRELMESCRK